MDSEIDAKKAKIYFKYLCASAMKHHDYEFPRSRLTELNARIGSIDSRSQQLRSTVSNLSNQIRDIEDLSRKTVSIAAATNEEAAPQARADRKQEIHILERKLSERSLPELPLLRQRRGSDNDKYRELEEKIEEKLRERNARGEYVRSSVLDDLRKVQDLERKISDKLTPNVSPIKKKLDEITRRINRLKKSKKYKKADVARVEKLVRMISKRIKYLEKKYSS